MGGLQQRSDLGGAGHPPKAGKRLRSETLCVPRWKLTFLSELTPRQGNQGMGWGRWAKSR